MTTWTLLDIRTLVEQENDLEDEDFIRVTELNAIIRRAVSDAEAKILTLYEDYFLDYQDFPIIVGQETQILPTEIYANKIRKITYIKNTMTYPVERLRDWKKFDIKADFATSTSTTTQYAYFITNRAGVGPSILLNTPSTEAWTMRVWYIRTAKKLVLDTDVCDIPFIDYIFAYCQVKSMRKEGHPGLEDAKEYLREQSMMMESTLSNMVIDSATEIEADFTNYEDMN